MTETLTDHDVIRDYPTTLRPVEGYEFVGTFVRLDTGPEHPDYGIPFIAVFDDITKGRAIVGNGIGVDMVEYDTQRRADGKSTEWGFWLIHSVARDGLRAIRPAEGERIAGKYLGRRDKRNAKPNDPGYHNYRFVAIDRASEPTPVATWDSVPAEGDTTTAPF